MSVKRIAIAILCFACTLSAQVTVRGTNGAGGFSSVYTMNLPTGTVAGDFAIVFGAQGNSFTGTTPSGYTTIYAGSSTNESYYIGTKVLQASDIAAGNVQVNFSGAFDGIISIITFVGNTGGLRETHLAQGTGNSLTLSNTASSSVRSTDTAIYYSATRSGSGPAPPTFTPASGSATSLQTSTLGAQATAMASQPLAGGVNFTTTSFINLSDNGAWFVELIVEAIPTVGNPKSFIF